MSESEQKSGKKMADAHEALFSALRQEMLERISLHARMVSEETGRESLDERVMAVLGHVPRHVFVPAELQLYAYIDNPLPIGYGKTISQPFICALMTDLLNLQAEDRVLEVGTGLGYQAAVLACLSDHVYSIEMIEELARGAERRLSEQGYDQIALQVGDGSSGWSEKAPFDKIIVTAAPDLIPPALLNQLKPGGRMVIPAGLEDAQQLVLVEKDETGRMETTEVLRVRFSQLIVSH